MNKSVERETFIDSTNVKGAALKDKFVFMFLWHSVFPCCRERPQIVTLWVEWFGRLKSHATGLEASLSFLFPHYEDGSKLPSS